MSEKTKERMKERNIITQKPLSLLGRKPTCSVEEVTGNAETTGKRQVHRQSPSQRGLESVLRFSEPPQTLTFLKLLLPELNLLN